jgi:futalosine hydrolase
MPFKILYITATEAEAVSLKRVGNQTPIRNVYGFGDNEISLLVGGIGSVSTIWNIMQWLSLKGRPDLIINAGIAGSYNDHLAIGDVVMPETDCFADSGIEDGNNFITLAEAGLAAADEFPFRSGVIPADQAYLSLLKGLIRPVKAITVNTATGSEATLKRLSGKFDPDIETMEGAGFFYVCSKEKIPFFAVRAVSNKVEIRNRNNWDIKLAIDNLSEKIEEILSILNLHS